MVWGHIWGMLPSIRIGCPPNTQNRHPLTDTQVKYARAKDKPYRPFDGGGLYLEVMPIGSKLWRMKFRQANGKEGHLAFGIYPYVSLANARKKSDAVKKQKADGIDGVDSEKSLLFESAAPRKYRPGSRLTPVHTFILPPIRTQSCHFLVLQSYHSRSDQFF